ncbi:DUF5615 family PIN-like protein [Rhizobium jaguaris]|uniref:DUF5615 family PIN-like protein n=1 Tax=Rhizobium jaguaris TaxID=1312183 RepID=UPI0026DA6A72
MKFLIDECLSPELAKIALEKGYGETSHVVWMKLGGLKDWELKPIILEGDWTFVTKNSVDFRGPKDRPGTKGQYADVAIHVGLICLSGPPGMDLDMQIELFEQALAELDRDDDLVNQVLEFPSMARKSCACCGTRFQRHNHSQSVRKDRLQASW